MHAHTNTNNMFCGFHTFFFLDYNQAEILENYNNILKSCNALDYHDLINCSVMLLSDFPEGNNFIFINIQLFKIYSFVTIS